jgi:hypothetical protein
MARLQAKSLESPDEVRRHDMGRVEIFELDDLVMGRTVFEPGWHWAEHVRPIAGSDLCQYHHVGVCVQGRARVRMADGTSLDIGAGEAFEIPPGHDSWVVSSEPWITYDFAGMRSFARPAEAGERILASILFTDIVGSTARAEQIGTTRGGLVGRLNERPSSTLDRYRGRSIKTTGDGVAVFDGASGPSAAPPRSASRRRRWGWPCGPGSTRARWRSSPGTCEGWQSTWLHESSRSPAAVRSWCRARPTSSSPARRSPSRIVR